MIHSNSLVREYFIWSSVTWKEEFKIMLCCQMQLINAIYFLQIFYIYLKPLYHPGKQ